jgi:hypothetical protein
MRREAPSTTRKNSRKTSGKKAILLANPNEWFVWFEEAPYYEYGHKVLRALMQLRAGERFDRNLCPYEVAVRRNENGTFRIYARFVGEK